MAVALNDSFAPVTAHAVSTSTGPSSGIGKTVARTISTQPTRSLLSAKTAPTSASWSKGLPGGLSTAISNASAQFGVDPGTLAGIWKIESGSTFPNPAVNSSGYGGLFGTKNWNASTQAQANTAAQILASNIKSHGGNLGAALLAYSGGGYSSVPGGSKSGMTNMSLTVGDGGSDSSLPPPPGQSTSQPTATLSPSGQPTATADPTATVNFTPDPILTKAITALASYKIPGIASSGMNLKSARAAAAALLSQPVQQQIAAGKIGANNIVQFNRGQQQLLSQLPSQIADIYKSGIATDTQLAQSTANALQAANPNAANQAALTALGAPAAQQQVVAEENQAGYGGGGSVLQGFGNLGAQTLNQQMLASQAYAKQIPALVSIQGQQALSNYEAQQSAAIAKVLAQQPGLVAKLFSTISSSNTAAANLGVKVRGQNATTLKTMMPKIISSGGGLYSVDPITGQTTELHAPAAKAGSTPKVDKTASASTGQLTYVGADGQLHAFTDANGKPIPYVGTGSGSSLHYYKDASTGQTLAFDPATGKTYQLPGGAAPPKNVPVYQRTYKQGGYTYGVKPDGSVVRLPGTRDTSGAPGGQTPGEHLSALKDFQKIVTKAGSPTGTKAAGGPYRWNQAIYNANPATALTKKPGTAGSPWVKNQNYVPGTQPAPTVPYFELINQGVMAGLTRQEAINIVNNTPGYDIPGANNGRPFVTYSDYLKSARMYLNQNPTMNAATLQQQMDSTYYPNRAWVKKATALVEASLRKSASAATSSVSNRRFTSYP